MELILNNVRWPEGVRCPRCDNPKPYKLSRAWHWQCHKCATKGYRFSVITGTVFENTKYPLRTWFTVAFLMLTAKKGMSALQVKRTVFHDKASYETVWYMCHRIRAAMDSKEFRSLMGEVEIDEAYVGGEGKNAHRGNRGRTTKATPGKRGNLIPPKTPVIGAISRKGNVVAKVIGEADARTISRFVRETVSDNVSLVATDDHAAYRSLRSKGYPHESVDHSKGEYVRGVVHTAHLDSFWSLLKRGIMGNYHHVSKDYLPLYLAEFTFRHNHRAHPDMFGALIAAC
jgi:transposase-like protein/IS1 family transposase